mmetsp:Transcript_95590/g.247158  ORF Transcript_95590/g.247158 Transcript_95590/m.247158 type:complete len:422 (-) Transcript_95590:92-1357(-)|eukprot:CAMPEP_0195096722 /NCGR_PEP_ID=MMETSP0448-20130528/51716_1 /TAXON_ID=66468 /ORGANISM="Heterocapsa triquestra, Strain CCMP 448" /LENGTH=421 /DNA_ID=CAMNT_0040131143 /DNA_START=106 /DNA_END=1371 /DNA_ORIENTATION=+
MVGSDQPKHRHRPASYNRSTWSFGHGNERLDGPEPSFSGLKRPIDRHRNHSNWAIHSQGEPQAPLRSEPPKDSSPDRRAAAGLTRSKDTSPDRRAPLTAAERRDKLAAASGAPHRPSWDKRPDEAYAVRRSVSPDRRANAPPGGKVAAPSFDKRPDEEAFKAAKRESASPQRPWPFEPPPRSGPPQVPPLPLRQSREGLTLPLQPRGQADSGSRQRSPTPMGNRTPSPHAAPSKMPREPNRYAAEPSGTPLPTDHAGPAAGRESGVNGRSNSPLAGRSPCSDGGAGSIWHGPPKPERAENHNVRRGSKALPSGRMHIEGTTHNDLGKGHSPKDYTPGASTKGLNFVRGTVALPEGKMRIEGTTQGDLGRGQTVNDLIFSRGARSCTGGTGALPSGRMQIQGTTAGGYGNMYVLKPGSQASD